METYMVGSAMAGTIGFENLRPFAWQVRSKAEVVPRSIFLDLVSKNQFKAVDKGLVID